MRALTEAEVNIVSGGNFLEDIANFVSDLFSDIAAFGGDMLGFDGSFGYDGSSWGDMSFGGFAGAVGDVAGTLWTLPNTIIGATIGFVGWAGDEIFGDGSASIALEDGVIRFYDNPLVDMINSEFAVTFGDAQIYGSDAEGHTAHEDAHTQQYHILGPAFLFAYAVGGIVSVVNGGDFFGEGNFLEEGPYSNPPTAW